ncbi:MAG: GlxA family transcriptional regulator [Rhodobacteraceae bacterium]|nr:GlxA family transcriptional regulator [Paracoccaceae bacterium]
MTKPDHFVFLLIENFSHLAFACAIEPLRIANLVSGKELYCWTLASENGVQETCSNRSVTLVDQGLAPLKRGDHLFLISGIHVARHTTRPVLDYLRKSSRTAHFVGGICSGAYALAKAGLLDGKPCSIHWEFHNAFEEEFRKVKLQKTVFVADRKTPTASGGPAASDLMLHLIARKHGMELATKIADQMVYNVVRDERAEQRISVGSRFGARKSKLTDAIKFMEASLEEPLTTAGIADKAGISTRQLERLFRRHLNDTPSQYYLGLRLEKARTLLLLTDMPVIEISLACGFGSASNFSRVFKKVKGVSPYQFRLVAEAAR